MPFISFFENICVDGVIERVFAVSRIICHSSLPPSAGLLPSVFVWFFTKDFSNRCAEMSEIMRNE